MSEKEKAIKLINEIDEDKMIYVVSILENISNIARNNLEESPNAETLEAFAEGDRMLVEGTGQRFEGSTEDFFESLLEDEVC